VKARRVMIKVCSRIGAFTPEKPKDKNPRILSQGCSLA